MLVNSERPGVVLFIVNVAGDPVEDEMLDNDNERTTRRPSTSRKSGKKDQETLHSTAGESFG